MRTPKITRFDPKSPRAVGGEKQTQAMGWLLGTLILLFLLGSALLLGACDVGSRKTQPEGEPLPANTPSQSTSDTTHLTNLHVSGDAEVGTNFLVDGVTYLDNSEIDGNLDVDGTITATGAISAGQGIYVNGTTDMNQLVVAGHTTQTNNLVLVEASDGTDEFYISGAGLVALEGNRLDIDTDNDSSLREDSDDVLTWEIGAQDVMSFTVSTIRASLQIYGRRPIQTLEADTTYGTKESRSVITNLGGASAMTVTLPAATSGLEYCFYVGAAFTMTINVDAGDQIHHLTDGAGDRLQNAGSVGDSICLVAASGTTWIPLQEVGTWSDAD